MLRITLKSPVLIILTITITLCSIYCLLDSQGMNHYHYHLIFFFGAGLHADTKARLRINLPRPGACLPPLQSPSAPMRYPSRPGTETTIIITLRLIDILTC